MNPSEQRAGVSVPGSVLDTVETMILTITNPTVSRHERSWAEFTARATIEALLTLPVGERMEAMGMVVEYTNQAHYRGEHQRFYGVTEK